MQTLAILLLHPLRLFKHPADFLPDRLIEPVHPHLFIVAKAGPAEAGGIRAAAPIVGVARVIRPPAIGIATVGADE